MYRVILVDDEPWTLMGIKKSFKWEKKGFQVIKETTMASEALKVILEKQPDVVFTDIRMPGMTGLELMKKAREKGIQSEFVIISGFSEFAYAQEVIRQGGFDYLLKPLQFEEADRLLDHLSTHLRKKYSILPLQDNFDMSSKRGFDGDINENFKELLYFINKHYDRDLQLKELSNQYHLNFTYCCDLFKKVTKCTFSEYVTSLRMKKACELMMLEDISISEISARVGYKDYYYFNRVFKKIHGVSPLNYRRTRRNEQC